ncbi:RING finger protein 17, partial [Stegodyphus mimosarum]
MDSELEESISQLGKVEYEIFSKFSLLPKSELPDTYSVPEIPDSLYATDVEESCSTSTDTFSEDSLSISSPADSTSIQASLKCKDFTKMQPENVVVSHIKSPSSFWVQKCSDMKKLRALSLAIDKFCRFAEPKKHKPVAVEKGDVYLVQFSQDKKWYRGRVTVILEQKETQNTGEGLASSDTKKLKKKELLIEVLYIDYGNTETVPLSNFRNIQTRFLNLPGMAKECSLVDIKPANDAAWTIEAITTFTKFVASQPVTMQVYEERNNVYYVDLSQTAESDVSNDVPVSVRDALVFLELAVFPSGKISPCKQRVEPQYMPPEPLRANVNISAIISHVESPSHFYVQQMSTASYLSSLIFEMNEVYNNQLNPILFGIFAPRIGMICAAQFSLDCQWYRAQVIGLPGGAKVKVRYVDFGNTEVIHHKFLRKLLNKFSKLNIQAIPCKLADVTYNQEKGWSQQAKEWLTNQGARKQLTLKSLGMIPGENKAEVVLYYSDEDFEICINSLIVEEGLATSCGPHSKEVKKSKSSSSKKQISPKKKITPILEEPACDNFLINEPVAEEKKPQPTFVKPPPDTENKHMEVHVSWIESPDQFYIRIAGENEKKLRMLMDDMQKTYENMEGDLIDCTVGSAYAVMSTFQKKWFRGTVVSKLSDDKIQIHYLDYGMTEEVTKKDMQKLLEKFTVDEAFAISCHLVGIIPPGGSSKWPNVTIEKFRLLVASHETLLLTSKGEIDERKSLPSDLLIEEIVRGGALEPTRVVYKSITTELVNSGLALPVRKNIKESSPNSLKKTISGNESLAHLHGIVETTTTSEPSAFIPPPKEASKKENVVLDLKPKFVWKRAVPPSETKFKAFITNIGDDGSIHLYSLCEDPVTVNVIKKALQLKYGKEKPKCVEQVLPVGEACIARFSVDNLWYRAEVISASASASKVKVHFVDYGNSELVPLSDISTEIIMQTFPRQCLECVLYGIKPVDSATWDQEILNFLHNQFVEKEVTVEIKAPADKNRKLQCEIVTLSGLSLADLLISMGSALPVSESSSSSCSSITTQDIT